MRQWAEHSAAVARRINAERLALLGWSRAILLQLAHPLIAAGVSEHSTFRGSARAIAARLHHTVGAMLALTFGTPSSRDDTLDRIREIHRRVNGHLSARIGPFAAGTPYSAEDPELVLWVHVTLLDSIPLVYDRFVAPLSEAERDVYCVEAADTAVALGAREGDVPRTWDAARLLLNDAYASGRIVVGPQARALAEAVLAPPIPRPIAPVSALNRLVTIGLLPDGIRRQYGYEWSDRDERRLLRVTAVIHRVRRVTPEILALWPDARRRLPA
jgi:uncharacterized protein (DUF2236 family)